MSDRDQADKIEKLQAQVRELADRDAIRELTARYCWHVQHGEAEKIVPLFVADGVFDGTRAGIGVYKGHPALLKFYRETIAPAGVALPFIQNHVIEVDGDEARGTCALEGRFIRDGQSITGAGCYQDRYRRVDGKWRFVERQFTAFHMVPLSEGWAKQGG